MSQMPGSEPTYLGLRIATALIAMVLLWALGWWAMKSGRLELVMVTLVVFICAWAYAGLTWFRWVNHRRQKQPHP